MAIVPGFAIKLTTHCYTINYIKCKQKYFMLSVVILLFPVTLIIIIIFINHKKLKHLFG
jgi:hypothetical protein